MLFTGSRFGLSLTINIEQYEYMRGPQSDAGIKVNTYNSFHGQTICYFMLFYFMLCILYNILRIYHIICSISYTIKHKHSLV